MSGPTLFYAKFCDTAKVNAGNLPWAHFSKNHTATLIQKRKKLKPPRNKRYNFLKGRRRVGIFGQFSTNFQKKKKKGQKFWPVAPC